MNLFASNPSRCIRCGACVRDCPSRIIHMPDNKPPFVAEAADPGCLHCQHCLAVCPKAAVTVDGMMPEGSLGLSPAEPGALPTEAQVRRLARGRRTVRQYRKEDVDRAVLARLIEDLAYTPTGRNRRALGVCVIDSMEVMGRFRGMLIEACRRKAGDKQFALASQVVAEWEKGSDLILRGAPHAIAVYAPLDAACPQEDVVLALAYFELLAQSAGVGTTWCGLLKWVLESEPELKRAFGLPAENIYFYTLLFGAPDVRYARTVQRAWSKGAVRRVVL